MTHTVTGKLNRAANQHPGEKGTTFFVEIGEQHYNYKTKEKGWTNYSAAIFGNQNQYDYLNSVLIEGAIVSVTGASLIIDMPSDPQYKPRLQLQDTKLAYAHSGAPVGSQGYQQSPQQAPQQQAPMQQQAPQQQHQQAPQQQPAPQQYQQAPTQNQPMGAHQQQPNQMDDGQIPF